MEATVPSMRPMARSSESHSAPRNVGENERWISMFAAGAFVAGGLIRGSIPLVALGGALAYRAYTGHCHVYQAMEYSTADQDEQRPRLLMHE